jgi:hypothetical protein
MLVSLMRGRFAALSATTIMLVLVASAAFLGVANKAYAHSFSGDESASFLAKVQELKVQAQLIRDNLSNSTLVSWHIDKSGEFWNATDTKEVAEKNKRVADDISAELNTLFSEAKKANPSSSLVSQTVTKLDASLGEAVQARIDPPKLQNATVNALALLDVIDEVMEDYGIALGASEEGGGSGGGGAMGGHGNSTMTSMSENASATMSSSGSSNAGPAEIANQAAYQTSTQLASAARDMFAKVRTMAPANVTSSLDRADSGLADLQKAIADKAPADRVDEIVHGTIHPNLQAAFNLQVVPEFPLPVVGVIAAVIGIAVAVAGRTTRMFKPF